MDQETIAQLKLWHRLREQVVRGDIVMSDMVLKRFTPDVIELIRDDLFFAWLDFDEDRYNALKQSRTNLLKYQEEYSEPPKKQSELLIEE